MKTSYILGSRRIPFTKSLTHYMGVPTRELMTFVLSGLVRDFNLKGLELGDVTLGAIIKSSADWDLARECVLGSGLAATTPGVDTQVACGASLEALLSLSHKIQNGMMSSAIAGGVDTNSALPIQFPNSFSKKLLRLHVAKTMGQKMGAAMSFTLGDLKPQLPAVKERRTGLSMGEHCELMVKEWQISRAEQDELSARSHQTAAQAYAEGFYKELLLPFNGLDKDSTVRGDTSVEKLAKLKPAFDRSVTGTLTAGNSSPLTDGASAVLLGTEDFAKSRGLPLLSKFVDAEISAVDFVAGEGLLMAPTVAVGRMLQRQKMKLQDFDYYEIHEAFAGQALCTLRAWENETYCQKKLGTGKLGSIDLNKMNVKGGSLAIGHPFAATGTRIAGSLSKILTGKKGARGLISICTAGGMGVVAILEGV
jgi:acetyl-CoA C-acetyltransferase